ncbi:fen1-like nuclease [Pteropox virus]|uniref:Fen1-like nuclease n=1 Tax=Pteropox virus TaxID=1873698 RepID=A0A1B1MRF5_9POXV|nr:fen1-like nuclease [Pteropox virus]ANS71143.1 fen1-like nuclease [Pteropox virus]
MGIKNLKLLLVNQHTLKQCVEFPNGKYPGVFVDTMSIFMTLAYACGSQEELICAFAEKIQYWKSLGSDVILFVDKGEITIKTKLREKRKKVLTAAVEKKITDRDSILETIKCLENNQDEFADEMLADAQLKLEKKMFHISLGESVFVNNLVGKIISMLGEDVTVKVCEGIDAEMQMCIDAYQVAVETGLWPILASGDQDALLFATIDDLPKYFDTLSCIYEFLPCAYSAYISKLAVLANGCDFFPGLKGIMLTQKSIENMELFETFNAENAAISLATRNLVYTKGFDTLKAPCDEIVDFINRYAAGDITIYDDSLLEECDARCFIFTALRKKWLEFFKYGDNIKKLSIPKQLVLLLEERVRISKNDIDTLVNIIYDESIRTDLAISNVVEILGYEVNSDSEIPVIGISESLGILLYLSNDIYLNETRIIKTTDVIKIG